MSPPYSATTFERVEPHSLLVIRRKSINLTWARLGRHMIEPANCTSSWSELSMFVRKLVWRKTIAVQIFVEQCTEKITMLRNMLNSNSFTNQDTLSRIALSSKSFMLFRVASPEAGLPLENCTSLLTPRAVWLFDTCNTCYRLITLMMEVGRRKIAQTGSRLSPA